jgi:predicted DCC family thiol-disulfide oxidoreductase YuxK
MEMSKLSLHDQDRALKLVDIQQPEIENYPLIDPLKASQILHAIDDQQTLLLGLDVTYRA